MGGYNDVSAYMNSKKNPTIADVARQAGVSTATVSRVLNGSAFVNESTARSVQDAVAALGYRPLPAAQALAGKKTNTLGLVIPEIGGPFFVPLLRGIEAEARRAGFGLLVQAGPTQARLALGSHNTDGLLVYTGALDSQALASLEDVGLPVVHLYARPSGTTGAPAVTVDNLRGAEMIMDHLVTVHHCRKIAFLAGPENEPDALARLQGYRLGLAKHGLPYLPELVAAGDFHQAAAARAVESLLAAGASPDAVFAADDESAAGALAGLCAAGLDVPKDLALVGFDDVVFAAYLNPPLTTVHAPTEQVGTVAVQKLINLIQGSQVDQLTSLPTTLVVRRSCGCTPGED